MLRSAVTIAVTAIAVILFIVHNPGDAAREFLMTTGLLDTLQDTYRDKTPQAPEGEELPPPPPPPPPNPFGERIQGTDIDSRSSQEAFLARTIEALEDENRGLVQKMKEYNLRRGGSSIPSGDARAIQRQIEANNTRILDLRNQKSRLRP